MDDAATKELLGLMRDVRFLLWVNSRGEIAALQDEAFEHADERKAFKLLSEGQSYREVAKEVGPGRNTVGNWVKKWRDLGLVKPGETEPAVDPETLGI